MLARVINFIFTRTALGSYLNGKKSWISIGLLVVAAVIEFLEKLVTIFPDYVPLASGAKELKEFLDAAAETLATIGFGGLAAGLTHKAAKASIAKKDPK